MSGLSYFDALGVRGVDRKPLIIAELAGEPLENLLRADPIDVNFGGNYPKRRNYQATELACKQIAAAAATFSDSSPPG
jgi:hypothetical protein